MGNVYLVLDRQHDRPLALKVLLPEVAAALGDAHEAERFLREIRISAQLCHPHIVALYDSGQVGELLYYTMPYVPGESLRERIRREQRIPLRDAVTLARQVASALDYAHRQGVIHRDVKPENILLHEGEALVADFGIARALHAQRHDVSTRDIRADWAPFGEGGDHTAGSGGVRSVASAMEERITAAGLALGTPLYMSPEQATGEPVDDRSDIYALGCVVYEMLSGEPPFSGVNANAILARKLAHDMRPLRARQVEVPAAVDTVIRHALHPKPTRRYPSAEEFARALEGAVTFDAAETIDATGTIDVAVPVRKVHRLRVAVLIATAVTMGALGIAVMMKGRRDDTAPPTGAATIRAIAVLPIGADSSHTSLANNVHIGLMDELGYISALRVTGPRSSMRYREAKKRLPIIAKELDVDGLVVGFLTTVGRESVSVHLQIREGTAGRLIWARQFTEDIRRLERLQKDVTRDIVGFLQLQLSLPERQRLARSRVMDPRAKEAYQRGLHMSASFDPDRFTKSIAAFEEAIAFEPNDPSPYVALAEVYQSMVGAGHVTMEPAEAFPRARELVQRALQIDPDDAEAHVVLAGILHMWDWDWAGAEREFVRAIRTNPGSARAHFQYGAYLQSTGLVDSAVAELRRAQAIDPLSAIILGQLAWAHIWAGRPDSALYWTRMALDLEPHFGPALWVRGMAFAAQGQHDSSIAQQRRHAEANSRARVALAVAYAAAGRTRDFDRMLASLPPEGRRWALARASRFTGDREAAIRALEGAVERHMPWISHIRGDPAYEHLAADRRYQTLLQRIGLPPREPAKRATPATTTTR
jgi:serine/threonine-protein kinase